jgi:hypothetical protein
MDILAERGARVSDQTTGQRPSPTEELVGVEKWHALACGLQLMLFVLLADVYILDVKPTLRQQSLSDQLERIRI